MESVKNLEAGLFQKLTKRQRIALSVLPLMIITGGPAISFLISKIAPGTDTGLYALSLQILCILSYLFMLRSIHTVRALFIVLLFLVLGGITLLGTKS